MRIFLAGQKAFGTAAFALLQELGHEVLGVSAPAQDRLQAAAREAGVPWTPAGALTAETLPAGTELILAAHSHDFIGRRTRQRAALGALGYHPSLLPLHRGRDAVRWTVKMGDRATGGSIYWLTDTVDGGPLAAQDFCLVRPGETAEELWRRALFPMGLRLLRRVLGDIDRGRLVKVPQDEACATWEPSWERPPVRRPDLLLLGDGRAGPYQIEAEEAALHAT